MENQILDREHLLDTTNEVATQRILTVSQFILLSLASFGMYNIWWIYKSWKFFQEKDILDIRPAVRTIFSIFYLHDLFKRILTFANEKGYDKGFEPAIYFIGYVFVNMLSKLPSPFWLVSSLGVIFLVPPFKALNFAKQNSAEFTTIEQTSFTTRQTVLLIIGFLFATLVIWAIVYDPSILQED
jgi:hypothetical protein